jgi:D-glycero-alpha-D-manno-heptose 1-phosphate guanylyltransferase
LKELSAIILAGGFGTRLRSFVSEVPKTLAPINGRPFLEYQMNYWIEQGISDFILAVRYLYQKIISHFGLKYSSAILGMLSKNNLWEQEGLYCLQSKK